MGEESKGIDAVRKEIQFLLSLRQKPEVSSVLQGVMLCQYHSVVNRRNSEKRKKVTGVSLLWALACTVGVRTLP